MQQSIGTQSANLPKVFFPNLDGLRFIAFFSVFIYHCFYTTHASVKQSDIYQLALRLKSNGFMGVNFFFVLSGFLITYLLINEKEFSHRVKIGHFYIRRVLRIWPLYFACVFFGFVIFPLLQQMAGVQEKEGASPLMYSLFLANFDTIREQAASSVLSKLWSISVEEQFYLVWPLIMAAVPKRFLPWVFGLILAFTLVFRWENRLVHTVNYHHTFSVISDMALGGLLAYLTFYHEGFRQRITHLPRTYIVGLYCVGIAAIIFRSKIFHTRELAVFDRYLYGLFFAFVIAEQNLCLHSFYKIANNRWMSKWGTYTYGLYCLHAIGILVAFHAMNKLHVPQTVFRVLVVDSALALAVTLAIGWVSYTYFESPFLKLKDRFTIVKK